MPIYHKFYNNKKDILDRVLEDKSQLLDKINYTVRDTIVMLIKKTPWDRLLASEFLSLFKKKWFSRNEFFTCIPISNIKYNYLGLKHQNNFHLFNNQRDYALTHYFAKSKTTKSNVKKFLTDPLMIFLIKKMLYKNTNKCMEKLLEIP